MPAAHRARLYQALAVRRGVGQYPRVTRAPGSRSSRRPARSSPHGLGFFTDRAVCRRIAALQAAPSPCLWPLTMPVPALGALTTLGAADATGGLLRLLEPVLACE
ncbi:hypothetical protein STENM36S_08563 [Streptomyces tendae]